MNSIYLLLEIFSLQGDSLVMNYYDNDPIEVEVCLSDSIFSLPGFINKTEVNKIDSIEGDFTDCYKGDSVVVWSNSDKVLVTTDEFIYLLEPKRTKACVGEAESPLM